MHFREGKKAVLVEIERTLERVDPEAVERMVQFLLDARTVFIAGAGRSGLMIRSFAMRLAHLGRSVQVVGDVTTRGIGAGDVLLVASGSGETRGILAMAQSAVENGGKVGVITIFPESSLARLAACGWSYRLRRPRAGRRIPKPQFSPWEASSSRACSSPSM